MSRPLIGINTGLHEGKYHRLDRRYVDSVVAAGGVPVLVPFFRSPRQAADFVGRLDGLVFTGGDDLDPALWGEHRHPRSQLLPAEKQSGDLLAMKAALAADAPVLGICYGMQLLNVVRGGTLHQHLPDASGSLLAHGDGAEHPVKIERGSRTARAMGVTSAVVSSYHHQAVAKVGRDLAVSAMAPDGVVEALEDPGRRFLVAVQWHPERIQDRRGQAALVGALVREAGR